MWYQSAATTRCPRSPSQPEQAVRPSRSAAAPSPPPPSRITRAGTVALIGRPNVGKSTLLNALLGERIAITSHHAQTTRDRIAGILTREGVQYVFLDTPGLHRARHKLGERMNEVARAAAAECDVAVFMTEPEMRHTPEGVVCNPTVREDDRAILQAIPENTPVVLVVNKVDKVKPKALLFPLLDAYGKVRDVRRHRAGERAQGATASTRSSPRSASILPEGEQLYDEEELSDKPVRFFVGEFVREQILRRTRQEIPHGVAVTVEAFDENAEARAHLRDDPRREGLPQGDHHRRRRQDARRRRHGRSAPRRGAPRPQGSPRDVRAHHAGVVRRRRAPRRHGLRRRDVCQAKARR